MINRKRGFRVELLHLKGSRHRRVLSTYVHGEVLGTPLDISWPTVLPSCDSPIRGRLRGSVAEEGLCLKWLDALSVILSICRAHPHFVIRFFS